MAAEVFSSAALSAYAFWMKSPDAVNTARMIELAVNTLDMMIMPMRDVVDFLQDNEFEVYVVSGADRYTTRAAVSKELGIPKTMSLVLTRM